MTTKEWKPLHESPIHEWEPMTMNEMKEELMIMEETAAAQPFVDPRLEDKITELRQRIVEWKAEMLPW